jgi:hypothetical protein
MDLKIALVILSWLKSATVPSLFLILATTLTTKILLPASRALCGENAKIDSEIASEP